MLLSGVLGVCWWCAVSMEWLAVSLGLPGCSLANPVLIYKPIWLRSCYDLSVVVCARLRDQCRSVRLAPCPCALRGATVTGWAQKPWTCVRIALNMAEAVQGATKTPAEFLKAIQGKAVIVKLNSGVDYRGELRCARPCRCGIRVSRDALIALHAARSFHDPPPPSP